MRRFLPAAVAALLLPIPLLAQAFEQQGFLEAKGLFYPRTTTVDSGRAVGEGLFRYEASYSLPHAVRIQAGFEGRSDTHHQTQREFHLNFLDRGLQRPAFSVRRLSLLWYKDAWTLEVGKQFISWGKTDLLNPTNRFAPRDFINVAHPENLGVTATRLTYSNGSNSLDFVWSPFLTPTRAPLLNQRWVTRPTSAPADLLIEDRGARHPGGSQYGFRWNHIGAGYEYSVVLYEGSNYMPLFDAGLIPDTTIVEVQRFYPHLRLAGGDLAVPLPWFTLKAETAYFSSDTAAADEYGLYVVQLERQIGEYTLVGGYIGEYITRERNPLEFAPDRGLARSLVARGSRTIGPRSEFSLEGAVRQDLDGTYVKAEYSRLMFSDIRLTAGYALFRGKDTDFFGQYSRNSHLTLNIRYSF